MTGNDNAFDQLRLAAALTVLISHSFPLAGLGEPMVFGDTLGRLAVLVFFGLSGFFVCASWQRDPDATRFAIRRALRIYPGLVIAVVVTTLTLGLAATSIAPGAFLSQSATWAYILSNASGIANVLRLPGVFSDTGNPIFNDSLWTLRYEILMYVVLVCLSLTGRLRAACMGLSVACGASTVLLASTSINHLDLAVPGMWRTGLAFDVVWLARFGTVFFGAASLALLPRVPLDWRVGLALTALVGWLPAGRVQGAGVALVLPYLILLVGFRVPKWLRGAWPIDASFGVYIYAYPIQQIVCRASATHGIGWSTSLIISIACTSAVATMSWFLVERPALRLKPHTPRTTNPATIAT